MSLKLSLLLGLCGLTSTAHAEQASAVAGGGGMNSIILFGSMFIAMYFLMIRPQSKRAKEHRNLIANLSKGDEVVTQGGLLGKIERDAGSFFILTLNESVQVPVQKQSIVQVLPKGTLKTI